MRYAEMAEHLVGVGHGIPIGFTSHNHADEEMLCHAELLALAEREVGTTVERAEALILDKIITGI